MTVSEKKIREIANAVDDVYVEGVNSAIKFTLDVLDSKFNLIDWSKINFIKNDYGSVVAEIYCHEELFAYHGTGTTVLNAFQAAIEKEEEKRAAESSPLAKEPQEGSDPEIA